MMLKMLCISILLAFLSSIAAIRRSTNDQTCTSTVRVRLVGNFGTEVSGSPEVSAFRAHADGREFAKQFQNGVASGIPYGTYEASVRAPGFWPTARQVRVDGPDVWAVFALEIGMAREEGGLSRYRVAGTLNGGLANRLKTWVRISGVYSAFIEDSPVDRSGSFDFPNVPEGKYILTITEATTLVEVREIDVRNDLRLAIQLREKN